MSVSNWMGDHQGRPGAVTFDPFVGVDLNLVDRLSIYCSCRADTDEKRINHFRILHIGPLMLPHLGHHALMHYRLRACRSGAPGDVLATRTHECCCGELRDMLHHVLWVMMLAQKAMRCRYVLFNWWRWHAIIEHPDGIADFPCRDLRLYLPCRVIDDPNELINHAASIRPEIDCPHPELPIAMTTRRIPQYDVTRIQAPSVCGTWDLWWTGMCFGDMIGTVGRIAWHAWWGRKSVIQRELVLCIFYNKLFAIAYLYSWFPIAFKAYTSLQLQSSYTFHCGPCGGFEKLFFFIILLYFKQ